MNQNLKTLTFGVLALAMTQCHGLTAASAAGAGAATGGAASPPHSDLVTVEVTEKPDMKTARLSFAVPLGSDSARIETRTTSAGCRSTAGASDPSCGAAAYDVVARWKATSSPPSTPPCLDVTIMRKDPTLGNFELNACVPLRAGERTLAGQLRDTGGHETDVIVSR